MIILPSVVVDTTTVPYEVVARYRNNDVKPIVFPNIIVDVAKNYNNAFVLCEVNDIGGQVADIIQFDLEYENLIDGSNARTCRSAVGSRILW